MEYTDPIYSSRFKNISRLWIIKYKRCAFCVVVLWRIIFSTELLCLMRRASVILYCFTSTFNISWLCYENSIEISGFVRCISLWLSFEIPYECSYGNLRLHIEYIIFKIKIKWLRYVHHSSANNFTHTTACV